MTRSRRRFQAWIPIGVSLILVQACSGDGSDGAVNGSTTALVVDDWGGKTVSALCVGGEEDYGSAPGAATDVQEGIASLIGAIVVDDGCEATITVSLVGEARSATYANPESPGTQVMLYTGAAVQGTISLTADGEVPLTRSIRGSVATPPSITVGFGARDPSGAPFWGAVHDSVCRVLQRWFGADDPSLSACPEQVTVTFTTVAGHPVWSEETRAGFLDDCLESESMCLCFLYGAESVLTEAEWIGVRGSDIFLWPEDVWERVSPVWSDCAP